MTIVLGWWAIPLLFTIICFSVAYFKSKDKHPHGDFDFASGFIVIINFGLAMILSLVSWLIYFIIF